MGQQGSSPEQNWKWKVYPFTATVRFGRAFGVAVGHTSAYGACHGRYHGRYHGRCHNKRSTGITPFCTHSPLQSEINYFSRYARCKAGCARLVGDCADLRVRCQEAPYLPQVWARPLLVEASAPGRARPGAVRWREVEAPGFGSLSRESGSLSP
jgi:hypothetical protein